MKNQIKAIILRRLLKVFTLRSARPKDNSMKYKIPAGTEANKPRTATKPTAPDAELPPYLATKSIVAKRIITP